MKQALILLFLAVMLQQCGQRSEQLSYKDKSLHCQFSLVEGRFHGPYVSFYPNGQKKAEGNFDNNIRSGLWSVWDSNGTLLAQRQYSGPFSFTAILPKQPAQTIDTTLSYTTQINSLGYIDYFDIKEDMVIWAHRIQRVIDSKNNPAIFKNKHFMENLLLAINNGKVQVYRDEDMFVPLDTQIAPESIRLHSLKLIEDHFYDTIRKVMDCRVVGFCPRISDSNGKTQELFQAYYPDLRQLFATEKPAGKRLPENIKTLDDLFFFRYYSGSIIKEENMYSRPVESYAKGKAAESEALRIAIYLIENEHYIWTDSEHFTRLTE